METVQRQKITEVRIHEMAGAPPDGSPDWKTFASKIPVYPSIDMQLLQEGDEAPFYVTLDILRTNVTSANGLVYDEQFVSELVNQLPGLGAKNGHTAWTDTGAFSDEADWVGHTRVGDTVYAKAYIPPGEVRNQMRRTMGRGGKVRTSIEVWGTPVPILDGDGRDTNTYRLSDPELDAVDFVRFSMAALGKFQSGNPIHSTETKQEQNDMPITTVADVPQNIRDQLRQEFERETRSQDTAKRVTELEASLETATSERTTAQARIAELEAERDAATARVTELEAQHTQVQADLTDAQARLAQLDAAAFEQMLTNTVTSFTNSWQVRSEQHKNRLTALNRQFLRAVREAIGSERAEAKVKEIAQKVWDDEMKLIAEGLRDSMSGGSAHIGGAGSGPKFKEFSPDEVSAARAMLGV